MSDKMMDRIDVQRVLAQQCAAVGGPAAWARVHGISAGYLSDAMGGRKDVGPKILDALGLRKVTRYVERKGKPA